MSEGEIEVEAVSGYEVLPKEVIAEIGSVKLFSAYIPNCSSPRCCTPASRI
jgi:hypothetical protein